MKSMDFMIFDLATIVESVPWVIGWLNAPRKWTFRKCLNRFESNFHVYLTLGGRYLLAVTLVCIGITKIIDFH